MAFRRVVLQPTVTITAAPTLQEVKFSLQTTGWKSAFFWVNVFVQLSASSIMTFYGASSLTLNDAGGTYWISLGTITNISAVGAYKTSAAITPLPDFVRWNLATATSGSIEIVAYLWDT